MLRPASRSQTIDLDLLDVRDMAPVGYQRINKSTGKPVNKDHIVKGYQYEKNEYVLLNEEDFRQADVEATQTVDIVSFVDVERIPPYYFDTPYYLKPDKRGERAPMRCCTKQIETGKTHQLTTAAEEPETPRPNAKVVDMVALLKQSLKRRGKDDASSDSGGARAGRCRPSGPARPKQQTAAKRPTAEHAPAKRTAHAASARTTTASSTSRPATKRKHARAEPRARTCGLAD